MQTKSFLYPNNVVKEQTFEELYEEFFKMIQNEKWKILKVYGKVVDESEVEQQFNIELWKAFQQYDIEKGACISTYIYSKFRKAKRDVLNTNVFSKSTQFENKNIVDINGIYNGEDEGYDFSNREFEDDDNYFEHLSTQPDVKVLDDLAYEDILRSLEIETEEDIDLMRVLIDRKEFSVADYARKYELSRQGANKRLNALKMRLRKYYSENKY